MTQFIGVYENAYSKEYCDALIKYYEEMKQAGFGLSRQAVESVNKTSKDDSTIFIHSEDTLPINGAVQLMQEFGSNFWNKYYTQYANQFDILKIYETHGLFSARLQKTEIGGGYHVWHSETASRALSGRILAWTLYLNNVEEGGETEFLYQHIRVKPKTGMLSIFPASFTHTHRGNPPLSNSKYILTGWVEF